MCLSPSAWGVGNYIPSIYLRKMQYWFLRRRYIQNRGKFRSFEGNHQVEKMVQSDPDERLIYLACQHIFRGAYSQVRKLKTVKGLIRQNELALTDILREYDINRTSTVAKKLLDSEVFDSILKARIRFPELFDVSPT
jgi:hypothetical protein